MSITFSKQLAQHPAKTCYTYDSQGQLYLKASCFSWGLLSSLVGLPIFGLIAHACLVGKLENFGLWEILSAILGLLFIVLTCSTILHLLIYLFGRLEIRLSKEGGKGQYYFMQWPFGQPKSFEWQAVTSIYISHHNRSKNERDVLLSIAQENEENLHLYRFLKPEQITYLHKILSVLLEDFQAGELDLGMGLAEHLVE